MLNHGLSDPNSPDLPSYFSDDDSAHMAAIHLVPRELLSFISPAKPGIPYIHHIPASLARAQVFKHHNDDLSVRWSRFRSNIAHSKLDQNIARGFDEPQEGYSHPTLSSGSYQGSFIQNEPVNFLEDASEEYSTSKEGSQNIVKAEAYAITVQRNSAYMKVAQSLNTGDLDEALLWFKLSPPVFYSKASHREKLVELRPIVHLQRVIMHNRAVDMECLKSFALLAAEKNAASAIGYDIPIHFARFTNFESFQAFWQAYCQSARAAADISGASARLALENSLKRVANAVIRQLCLALKYQDALTFLMAAKSDLKQNDPQRRYHKLRYSGKIYIEAFTYKVLIEEGLRSNSFEALEQLHALVQSEWPLPPTWTQDVATDKRGQIEQHHRYISNLLQAHQNLENKRTTEPSLEAGFPDGFALDQLSVLPSNRTFKHKGAKSEYSRLAKLAREGYRISSSDMAAFQRLCADSSLSYLYKALQTQVKISETRRYQITLMESVRSGNLPTAEEIRVFIHKCQESRTLQLAKSFGEWLQSQGMRHKALWLTTRMHRLVEMGVRDPRCCADALRIFTENFVMAGVPDQISRMASGTKQSYTQAAYTASLLSTLSPPELDQNVAKTKSVTVAPNPQTSSISTQPRPTGFDKMLWPSSHTIGIAIRAWLMTHPNFEDILQTYTSFVDNTYNRQGMELPPAMLPDQQGYNYFLLALVKINAMQAALQILSEMNGRGLSPSRYNWDTVLGGFARTGDTNMVNGILDRMEANVSKRTGDKESASSGPVQSTEQDSSPSAFDSAHLLDEFDFPSPGIVTYTTIIRGLCLARKLDEAETIKQRMFASRDEGGSATYKFGMDDKTEKAISILASMKRLVEVGRANEAQRQMGFSGA